MSTSGTARGARRRLAVMVAGAVALGAAGGAFGDLLGPGSPGVVSDPRDDLQTVGHEIAFDRDIRDYVLFALERIDLKGDSGGATVEGELRGGHVGVNAPGFGDRGVPRLSLCQGSGAGRVTRMDAGTQVVADTAVIASACHLWDVKIGTGVVARVTPNAHTRTFRPWYPSGAPGPLLRPNDDTITEVGELPPMPPVVEGSDPAQPEIWSPCAAGRSVVGTDGGGATLTAPGGARVLGDTLLRGDVTIGAGVYTVCDFTVARGGRVTIDPGVELRVWGDFELEPASDFGGPASRDTKVTVNGTAVRFGRNNTPRFSGQLWAPNARVNLGNGTHVYGRLWAKEFVSDWNVSINDDCPAPTPGCSPTTTSSSTPEGSTSTTEGGF